MGEMTQIRDKLERTAKDGVTDIENKYLRDIIQLKNELSAKDKQF